MSVSEPEIPKPDESVVETPSPNFLGDLEAQSKALREELDTARQRLAVVEKQIADSAADRTDDEPLRQQLQQTQDELDRTRVELASKCEECEELKRNPAPAIEPIDSYVFLDWLKGLIKGKSRKPPQWEPTKADVEAILERVRQP